MPVRPPRPSSPPLNALRAFEAAARLGGVTKAAEELCVTPGAIAQHIKALEDWAGARLFDRHAKGVTLNELGERSLPDFLAAFDQMNRVVQNLRMNAAPNSVRIATLPSLAQLWLSPRMPGLRAAFPQARISIAALEQPPNLAREGYDIAIFLEPKTSRGGLVLAEDHILPVCAPALAKQVQQPADLAAMLWLKDSLWPDDWAMWVQKTQLALPNLPETVSYSLYSLALEEARNGAGILMGHDFLVQASLLDGSLVAPFNTPVSTGKVVKARLRDGDQRGLSPRLVRALAAAA